MNNHLDDFLLKMNQIHMKFVGTHFNYLKPLKRPLSSMTPTVLEDDNSILVIGTPGGSRIISMVAQYLSHYLFFQICIRKYNYYSSYPSSILSK